MAGEVQNNAETEDDILKTRAKKGVSITISLVMLGFKGWKDLEPGNTYLRN